MDAKRVEELVQERRKMVQIREDIAKKEADIEDIREAGRKRSRLEKQGGGWLNYWTTGWGRTAAEIEEDKVKREQENLQRVASERIKIELLERQKRQLQKSETYQQDQVLKCEAQNKVWKEKVASVRKAWETEINRKAAEQWRVQEEERKRKERERLAQEAKKAAERQKAAEERERQEQERRNQMADETQKYFDRLTKARAERVVAEREAAARRAQELRRDAEEKLKKEQRRARRYAETNNSSGGWANRTEARQRTSTPTSRTSTRFHNNHRNTRSGSSLHQKNWRKVQGSNMCSVCAQWFHLFILQCPQCDRMACAGCKRSVPGPCQREEISNTWEETSNIWEETPNTWEETSNTWDLYDFD